MKRDTIAISDLNLYMPDVERDQEILPNPKADMPLFAKDVLYIIGSPDKLAEAAGLLDNP